MESPAGIDNGAMYVPRHFAASDEDVRRLLAGDGAADLITFTEQGLLATFLPFLYDAERGAHGALLGTSRGTTISGGCQRSARPW